jgi:hypothetical protein
MRQSIKTLNFIILSDKNGNSRFNASQSCGTYSASLLDNSVFRSFIKSSGSIHSIFTFFVNCNQSGHISPGMVCHLENHHISQSFLCACKPYFSISALEGNSRGLLTCFTAPCRRYSRSSFV